MFDIGFWELATIAIIGIVVIGPKRLPEVVRTLFIILRKIRRTFNHFKDDIERELELDELRRHMDDLDIEAHIKKMNQSVMDMDQQIRKDLKQHSDGIEEHYPDYEKDFDFLENPQAQGAEMADTGEERATDDKKPSAEHHNELKQHEQ